MPTYQLNFKGKAIIKTSKLALELKNEKEAFVVRRQVHLDKYQSFLIFSAKHNNVAKANSIFVNATLLQS